MLFHGIELDRGQMIYVEAEIIDTNINGMFQKEILISVKSNSGRNNYIWIGEEFGSIQKSKELFYAICSGCIVKSPYEHRCQRGRCECLQCRVSDRLRESEVV